MANIVDMIYLVDIADMIYFVDVVNMVGRDLTARFIINYFYNVFMNI